MFFTDSTIMCKHGFIVCLEALNLLYPQELARYKVTPAELSVPGEFNVADNISHWVAVQGLSGMV